jgi:hypothetical protein
MRNVLDKLRIAVDSKTTHTAAGPAIGGFTQGKGFGIRTVPEIKSEAHSSFVASAIQGLPASGYPTTPGQATFTSYTEAQSIYSATQMSYTPASYGAGPPPTNKLPSTLGSNIGYSAAGQVSYFGSQDGTSASRTTTPATDWMRWSQTHLNPFAQQSQPDYMTPSAATTLMSMSDTRSGTGAPQGGPGGQQGDPHQQWPFNYYNNNQYATSHPG